MDAGMAFMFYTAAGLVCYLIAPRFSLYPIGDKDIRIPGTPIVPVARKHDFPAVGAEHGKRVKTFIAADLLYMTAV